MGCMEKGFVNLITVYSNRDTELNIESLSSIYDDRVKLRDYMHQLFIGRIEPKFIAGKSVLLKPNWVRHCIKPTDNICLCTHEHFVLAVLEEVLSMKPSRVLIADAPVNICKWEALLSDEFLSEIERLRDKSKIEISIKDFRRTITDLNTNTVITNRVPIDEYILFDVGEKSLLEPITTKKNKFRITNYNPDDMINYHAQGKHTYCIARDFFDYDVVFSLPKLKTHQKAGFTNALKILVGINGDKDYLPHHRLGAANHGGDCYKEDSFLRRIGEWASDQKNRNLGNWKHKFYDYISSKCWLLSHPEPGMSLGASWYGNDTIWRTVMDIQMIAEYGCITPEGKGVLNESRIRKVYSICDGIIGGQGDGPLNPDPLPLGIIALSDNPYLMDIVGGTIMGLNIERIPLLRFAFEKTDLKSSSICLNNHMISLSELSPYCVSSKLPSGWLHYND